MKRQILITGASSDIGIAVCRYFLSEGHTVIAHYFHDSSMLNQLREKHEAQLIPYKADFSDPGQVAKIQASDADLFAATDVLINMAALRESVIYGSITADDLLHHFTVNVIPMVLFMQWLGPKMADRGWGRIVNISSIGVKFGGGVNTFSYSLTKHAAEFMPAIHKAWVKRGVLVNTLRVGVTETRRFTEMSEEETASRVSLIPAGRMATPDEMAETIYWLGSDSNSFMTGQVISAAGGE